DGHDAAAAEIEALLDQVLAGLPAVVDRLAVEEADELVEGRTERDARIVDEAPRLVELAAGGEVGVEVASGLAGCDSGDEVAREVRRNGLASGELDEVDRASGAERRLGDVLQLGGERLGRRTDGGRRAEAAKVDVLREGNVGGQRGQCDCTCAPSASRSTQY